MAAALRQDTRLLRMNTPLGTDKLVPSELRMEEGLSRPFTAIVRCIAREAIDTGKLLGQPAVVTLTRDLGDDHHFHGFVISLDLEGYDGTADTYIYELVLAPFLWFLSKTTDSRIFQDSSSREIIEEMLRGYGFSDFEFRLSSEPPKRPYCVQYRESALDFISRLLEEDGILYFFVHEGSRHRLVLIDDPTHHPQLPGGTLTYRKSGMEAAEDSVGSWTETANLTAGHVALSDWNPETASQVEAHSPIRGHVPAVGDIERFDHPGLFADAGLGNRLAKLEADRQEATQRVAHALANAPGLRAGVRFTLAGHDVARANIDYTVLTAHHQATNNVGGAGAGYSNRVSLVPNKVVWRPPRRTAKPIVPGTQTATVVGPPGEEIHTDALGRIKVRFHWDRRARNDAVASCFIRVAQAQAGLRWGALWLPRVGTEVLVDFLEGDPDRPIVTGVVYNGINRPPVDLPAKATLSGWRTSSTPGGGGFNELSFDDRKGQERVFLHAQRRLDLRAGGDGFESIGGSRHQTVGGDRLTLIGKDEHLLIKGDSRVAVDGEVGLKVGEKLQVRLGDDGLVTSGGEVVVTAASGITLRVGGSVVRIDSSGVAIRGGMVRINSGGGGGSRRASPDTPKEAAAAATGQAGDVPKPGRAPILLKLSGNRGRIAQTDAFREAAATGAPFVQPCPPPP
ncbi:MAG: hypothetical protein RLY86_28 [Pseudomonadota bacterium]|jgi:type VI secretion system secreted protein VgrG